MSLDDPISSYQQSSARGASPVGQIVALYDTILRDFVRAQAAQQAGNIETRVLEMNHAVLVIGHLQSILNHERGGEAAKNLDRLYAVTRGMILRANLQPTPQAFEELIELYAGVRKAWQKADQKLALEQPKTPPQEINAPSKAAAPAPDGDAGGDLEFLRIQWSA